ncbi:MAG: hypothetical protein V1767_05755 [Chloroflexota bacterium]
MVNLPKLKVQGSDCEGFEGTHDFEEARNFPFGRCVLVVEQQVIGSYQDLVRFAEQPEYKNRGILDVEFLDIAAGG